MEEKKLDEKLTAFFIGLVILFAVLVLRLADLQLLRGDTYLAKAEANSTRIIPIPARRGDILDRNGLVLATSRPVFVISLNAYGLTNIDQVADILAPLIGDPEITPAKIRELIDNNPFAYEAVEIARLPWDEPASMKVITRIEEKRAELPGVSVSTEPVRYYPNEALAGHVLGYVGRITEDELERYPDRKYSANDLIGKTGLEELYESYIIGDQELGLRGQVGMQRVGVDVQNRPVGDPNPIIPPASGGNLYTTLDLSLQQAMESSLDQVISEIKKRNPKAGGAGAVALDVRTGAVLAMASRPQLNPNDFVDGLNSKELDYYYNPNQTPFNNRAVQGTYPPGSTFKMITAMAGLESGAVDPELSVTCTGHYWQPPYISCWSVHGVVDVYRALAVSCNTYFQHAGFLAGIDNLVKVGKEFGLGSPTGARDISGERSGLLPSPEWKKEVGEAEIKRIYARKQQALEDKYNALLAKATSEENRSKILRQKEQDQAQLDSARAIDYNFLTTWQPFDTFNMSMGQGANTFTVLQLANYVATLANGGQRWQPYLVKRIVNSEGETVADFGPRLERQVRVSPKTLAIVREGMHQVCEPGGTAYSLFSDFPPEIGVAGKTGTAETGLAGDNPQRDFHGVFVGFAPHDDPEIAIAVLVEYGEHGGGSAARVAREVFRTYFGLEKRDSLSFEIPGE